VRPRHPKNRLFVEKVVPWDGMEIRKQQISSGKRLHNYGKSPCLMGKSTISMAIFNSYVSLPEGILTISWQSVAKCCFEMNMMNVAHQNW